MLNVRSVLLLLCGLALYPATPAYATSTWTGTAGNFLWNDAGNWDPGVPSKAVTDTAIFDADAAAGGTITWATGSANQPKNTNFSFLAGTPGFTFAGSAPINNAANSLTYTTAADVTTDQTFASVSSANFTVTLDGSGDMTFTTLSGANSWNDVNFNTLTANVNHAAAVLNIGTFTQNRSYNVVKSGAGKLAITGTIEIAFGIKNTSPFDLLISTIKTSGTGAGTIDISTATADFETHLDLGEMLADGTRYVVVDYANATLIGTGTTGFAAVTGDLPDGWGLFNDAADSRVYLQQVPEPAVGAPLLLAGLAAMRRRRRTAV